jgi:AAA domain
MRPDTQYLIDISHPSKEFDALKFVEDCICHEIEQLRHASITSSLHGYVTQNGYPIPKRLLKESSYINRPGLEKTVDEALSSGQNLYLIGCEGSGKTTLLHYVISERYNNESFFAYVDVSDIGSGTTIFADTVFDKIRNSLFLGFSQELRDDFRAWIQEFEGDPFARDLVNTSSTKRFVEAIMVFLNSRASLGRVYFVIDNIDSLKSKVVEEFFASLHMLEETVASAFHSLNAPNNDRVRFIVCCRTQSIDIVTSASHGLFTRSAISTIDMDDRFIEMDVLSLTRAFLLKDKDYIFKHSHKKTPIRAWTNFGSISWESFEDYSEDVFDWLAHSSDEVHRIVTRFCGRSIRRAKLFLVKALASPVIARLVFFEKHKIYNITRDAPEYLSRRMLEALFDFSTSPAFRLPGYPLNPFKVLRMTVISGTIHLLEL